MSKINDVNDAIEIIAKYPLDDVLDALEYLYSWCDDASREHITIALLRALYESSNGQVLHSRQERESQGSAPGTDDIAIHGQASTRQGTDYAEQKVS